MKLHIEFCRDFGLSPKEIENQEESQGKLIRWTPTKVVGTDDLIACTAYTRYDGKASCCESAYSSAFLFRYVLDVGQVEDWFGLQTALLPCLLGYGIIARRLHDDPKTVREGNRYTKWVDTYIAEDYEQSVRDVRGKLEHPWCMHLWLMQCQPWLRSMRSNSLPVV